MRTALCAPPIYDTLCESAPDSVSIAFRAIVRWQQWYTLDHMPWHQCINHDSHGAADRTHAFSRCRFAIFFLRRVLIETNAVCYCSRCKNFISWHRKIFYSFTECMEIYFLLVTFTRYIFSMAPITTFFRYQYWLSVSLRCEKKVARHVEIFGVRNNISTTREIRGGEFVKGRRKRRVFSSVCKLGFGSI